MSIGFILISTALSKNWLKTNDWKKQNSLFQSISELLSLHQQFALSLGYCRKMAEPVSDRIFPGSVGCQTLLLICPYNTAVLLSWSDIRTGTNTVTKRL